MVSKVAILDTGALIAFLSRADRFHLWAKAAFKKLPPALITTESVLSEVFFLLRRDKKGLDIVSEILTSGSIKVVSLCDEIDSLIALVKKYSDVPMSYADASLVRLTELQPQSVVVSIDNDFSIYRIKKNQKLAIISPS